MFSVDEFDASLPDTYYTIAYDRNPANGLDYFIIGDGPRSILTYNINTDQVNYTGVNFEENIADITVSLEGTCYAWIGNAIHTMD